MTADELRGLKARLEATLTRPQHVAVPVDVPDVRALVRLITLELAAADAVPLTFDDPIDRRLSLGDPRDSPYAVYWRLTDEMRRASTQRRAFT